MTTATTTLTTLTTLLIALQVLSGIGTTTEPTRMGTTAPKPVEATLTVDVEDAGWAATIEWAIDRYESVGLSLPAGTVSVHADKSACRGNSGLYVRGEVPEVRFCADTEPTSRVSKLIVLHELGHLWAEKTLTDAERQALLDLRGLEVWADRDHPAHEWGAEHAAEILSWGLMDEAVRIVRIYDADPESLTEAWMLLVGRSPLTPAAPSAPVAVPVGGIAD